MAEKTQQTCDRKQMTDEMKEALAIFEDMVQRRMSNTGEDRDEAYEHVMNFLIKHNDQTINRTNA